MDEQKVLRIFRAMAGRMASASALFRMYQDGYERKILELDKAISTTQGLDLEDGDTILAAMETQRKEYVIKGTRNAEAAGSLERAIATASKDLGLALTGDLNK